MLHSRHQISPLSWATLAGSTFWSQMKTDQGRSHVGDDPSRATCPEEYLRSVMTSGKDVADPPQNILTTLGNTGKLNILESGEDRPKTESHGDGDNVLKASYRV